MRLAIHMTHPDLTDQLWSNSGETLNGFDDDGNLLVDDVVGWDTVDWDNDPSPVGSGPDAAHGTMVAGIVASSVNGIATESCAGVRGAQTRCCN